MTTLTARTTKAVTDFQIRYVQLTLQAWIEQCELSKEELVMMGPDKVYDNLSAYLTKVDEAFAQAVIEDYILSLDESE